MTAADAKAWLDYYQGKTTAKPVDSKTGKQLTEPDWADQIADTSEWDENEAGQEWYNYYMGITDKRPAEQGPGWIQAWKDQTVAEWAADPDVSQEEIDALDQWVEFYERKTTEKPTLPQSRPVKDWGVDGMKEGDLYPADLPTEVDPNWTDAEKAWFNYYDDKRDLAKLEAMAKEEMYIDLGMGAGENTPLSPRRGRGRRPAESVPDYAGAGRRL